MVGVGGGAHRQVFVKNGFLTHLTAWKHKSLLQTVIIIGTFTLLVQNRGRRSHDCLTGGHVLQGICLSGDMSCGVHVFLGTCLLGNMSYRRIYLIGGHVLQEDMSYIKKCLMGDMSYGRTCFTEGYVLLEDMFYWNNILQEDMSYVMTCLFGGHVL